MLTGVDLANNEFDENIVNGVRITSASVSSFEEKEEDNTGAVEGKRETGVLGGGFEQQQNQGCCEHEICLGISAFIQVSYW
jgi:hypothetical protein